MVQIIAFFVGVVALYITPTLAGDPRAATLEVVTVSADLTVKLDPFINYAIAQKRKQEPKITEFAVKEYAKAFTDYKSFESTKPSDLQAKRMIASEKLKKVPEAKRDAAVDYAKAFADFKSSELKQSADLEDKRYNAARKLAELGFIVFVFCDPQNYIVVPAKLIGFFSLHKLFRYVFAELQLDELIKDIEDAQVKQITRIHNGRIYYNAFEFTSFRPFGTLVLTLGSVHFGKFYMESGEIQKHDNAVEPENRIVRKTFSGILDTYVDQEFTPVYDHNLTIGNEPWVGAVKGTIRGIGVKFIVEATLDGRKTQLEFDQVGQDLKTMEETRKNTTLQDYIAALKKSYEKPNCTDVKLKYYFIFNYK